MSQSSGSSAGRAKSNRQVGRRQSLGRRLRIEAMEGRVLLSGNTLDLSTFGNDLAPASYQTSSTGLSGQNNSVTNAQFNLPTPTGDSLGSGTISPPVGTIDGEVQPVPTVAVATINGEQFTYVLSLSTQPSDSRYSLSADGHLVRQTTGQMPSGALNSALDFDYSRYNLAAPSAIGGDPAPVDYLDTIGVTDLSDPSALNSHKTVVAGTIAGNSSNVTIAMSNEGGLTLTVPITGHGSIVGATSDLFNAAGAVGTWPFDTAGNADNNALGSGTGTPRVLGSAGGPDVSFDLGLVGDGIHVPTHPDLTPAVDDMRQVFSESGSAWQAIRINAEPGPYVVLEAVKGSVEAEGGLIQLARLARFSTAQLSENSQATAAADADGHELDSSHEAGDVQVDSVSLEGEWDRAIAMETIGTTGLSRSADQRDSRDASPDETPRADGREPLSTDDSKAHLESQSEGAESATEDAAGVGRITSAASASEHAGNARDVTPVVYVGSPRPGDMSSMLAQARRLDRVSRVGRGAKVDDGRDTRLVREEAFSDWHNGAVADANPAASQPSQYRLRVNPWPFLAVLALERLAALDPQDNRRRRDAVGKLACDDGRE